MLIAALILVAGLVLILAGCLVPLAWLIYRRYRYRKIVICPNTHDFAEVALDARRAAWNAVLGKTEVCVRSCSYWPRKKGCPEHCVKENWPVD